MGAGLRPQPRAAPPQATHYARMRASLQDRSSAHSPAGAVAVSGVRIDDLLPRAAGAGHHSYVVAVTFVETGSDNGRSRGHLSASRGPRPFRQGDLSRSVMCLHDHPLHSGAREQGICRRSTVRGAAIEQAPEAAFAFAPAVEPATELIEAGMQVPGADPKEDVERYPRRAYRGGDPGRSAIECCPREA